MRFTSFVAWRYLTASSQNRFFSWITALTVLGICISAAAMILVLSVIDGFEAELRERFLAANAHVLGYRFPSGLRHPERWIKDVEKRFKDDITGATPFVYGDTIARSEGLTHSVLVRGITPVEREKVQSLDGLIDPPQALAQLEKELQTFRKKGVLPEVPGIIVGSGFKDLSNTKNGDIIEILAPSEKQRERLGTYQRFRILGTYRSGLQHYDNRLGILSLPAAQRLFHLGKVVTGFEVGLKDPDKSKKVAARMREEYPITIKEWQSYNKNIFEAMRNERAVIALIVALVAFVASFNIITTLFVSVSLKQRDISLLKALGASNMRILVLFLKQSTLMGLLGSLGGVLFALAFGLLLKHYPIIELPDIYLLKTLPVAFSPRVYITIAGAGFLIAALAGLYPAYRAAQVSPTEGLVRQ